MSRRSRARRARLFRESVHPSEDDRILDLGSEDGGHIAALIPFRENVWIADISRDALVRGRDRFGFRTVQVDEGGRLPFDDGAFDIVHCSSVIEHVTVPKDQLDRYRSGRAFADAAWARQRRFAREIRRVARRYFVQTPNKYFPVETHTWLPAAVVMLPRPLQVRLIGWMNRWWPKKTAPDWHLLTRRRMRVLFPDAEIVSEKSFGFTKSIMAIRR